MARKSTISTELVRAIKTSPPTAPADYRDPKVPGFVLRARPTGVHTWRVQLPDRSWISLGRTDEVSLADARDAAQHCRARVGLGQVVAGPTVADTLSLADFLCDHYGPWMSAMRGPRSGQVARIQSAFADLLDLPLGELTTARLEHWRAERRYRRRTPGNVPRRIALPTVNRDLAALQSALQRAVEWGQLRTNPLRAVKRGTEDGSASIRFLSKEEEQGLRAALGERGRPDARPAPRLTTGAGRVTMPNGDRMAPTRTTSRRWCCSR